MCAKKNDIKIWADGGTLLGAIRHGGFIPWDDDIDMMMKREDYEKLCSIASKEFQTPYFFQTEYTDPGSLRPHAQLRNSFTTGILQCEKECKYQFNQGIFIDIFPLDSVIDNDVLYKKQGETAARWMRKALSYSEWSYRFIRYDVKGAKEYTRRLIYFFTNFIIRNLKLEQKAFCKFERACMMYNDIDTDVYSQLSMDFDNKSLYRDRADYIDLCEKSFEFLRIPVPIGYEHELNRRYGDWKKFIMDESTHGGIFVDADKSYKEFI